MATAARTTREGRTPRQHTHADGQGVERVEGADNPTPTCRMTRRSRDFDARISSDTEGREATTREEQHRGAYPTRRKTRKWMGPTADVSSSTEVDGTYRRCVKRHKGQGTPTPTSRTTNPNSSKASIPHAKIERARKREVTRAALWLTR